MRHSEIVKRIADTMRRVAPTAINRLYYAQAFVEAIEQWVNNSAK